MITTQHKLPPWTGETTINTYGGKQLLNKNNEPVFAEIYALKIFQEQGYKGVWVDNYRKRLVNDMTLTNLKNEVNEIVLSTLEKINGNLFRGGTWDLLLWNEDEIKFVELKRRDSSDKIRPAQIEFHKRALELGYKEEQFEVFEWELEE